jgi:hypothetical protein
MKAHDNPRLDARAAVGGAQSPAFPAAWRAPSSRRLNRSRVSQPLLPGAACFPRAYLALPFSSSPPLAPSFQPASALPYLADSWLPASSQELLVPVASKSLAVFWQALLTAFFEILLQL